MCQVFTVSHHHHCQLSTEFVKPNMHAHNTFYENQLQLVNIQYFTLYKRASQAFQIQQAGKLGYTE